MRSCVVLCLLIFMFVITAEGTIRRVPQDYAKIQLAINASIDGDTVLVSEGTYFENLVLTKKIVLGSYFIIDRDTSHISKTVIDGSTPRHPDSASVILITTGTDSTTVISGFTLRRGSGTRVFDSWWNQHWRCGGGIVLLAGGARIANNIIANNTLITSDAVVGGGIHVWTQEGPIPFWIIEDNKIINNNIRSTSVEAEGGAVHLTEQGRFNNNVVMNNSVAGVNYGHAGGIWITSALGYGSTYIELSNNYICGNTASHSGGGMLAAMNGASGELTTTILTNNVFCNNSSSTGGAAIQFQSGIHTLINNTLANNNGPNTVRVFSTIGALVMRMLNNILWNPSVSSEYVVGSGTYTRTRYSNYNCVRTGLTGTNNITGDPNFMSGDTLYRLSQNSPCIGTGISSEVLGGETWFAPPFDFLKTPRPRGTGTQPDMGAIENDFPVGVSAEESQIHPALFALEQNYPNPFNPSTIIKYSVPVSAGANNHSSVQLKVFDILGREVATLVNEEKAPGNYEVEFSGVGTGLDLSAGVYFYQLRAGAVVITKKMLLIK